MTNWAKTTIEETAYGENQLANRIRNGLVFHGNKEKIAVLQPKPVHFFENNEWKEIDTRLVGAGDGSYGAPGLLPRILSDGQISVLGKAYGQFTSGAGTFDAGTKEYNSLVTFGAGVFAEDRLVRTVGPHTHEIILTETGIKEQITLAQPIPNLTGTHFGTYTVLNGVDISYEGIVPPGTQVGGIRIEGGSAYDSGGNETPVTRFVKQVAGKPVFVSAVPISWLESAVYPVVIDPTFTSQPNETVGQDTFLSSVNATVNYGTENYIRIEGNNAGTSKGRTLIKFDFSSIPAVAKVSSATFSHYQYSGTPPFNFLYNRILVQWWENTVTWNRRDGASLTWNAAGCLGVNTDYASTAIGSYAYSSAGSWITPSINTAVMEGWISGAYNNYGMLVWNDSGAGDKNSSSYSSTYTTAALRPMFEIVYTVPGRVFTVIS